MASFAALKVHLNYDHDNGNCLIRFFYELKLTSDVKFEEHRIEQEDTSYSIQHMSNCAQSLRYRICPLKLANKSTNSTLTFQVSGVH